MTLFERNYPFGWLGILAEAPPSSPELVYANHDERLRAAVAALAESQPALPAMRAGRDIEAWSDDRIWAELRLRTMREGFVLNDGPILQRGITPMRSFVVEPMRFGRLFLLGDAAHIVPPTGAKGLNLAVADVAVLARALERYFAAGCADLLEAYSATCLVRVWKVQRFSWWMTSMLHRFEQHGGFDQRVQLAELE